MKTKITLDRARNILSETKFHDYTLEYVDEGVSTDVFKLVKNNNVNYLRILPEGESAQIQSLAHNLMLEKGISVPKVLFCSNKRKLLQGRSFMIVEEIKGESVKIGKSLNNKQLSEIVYEAGKELALINTINVSGVGSISSTRKNELIAEGKNYHDFILWDINRQMKELVEASIFDEKLVIKLEEYIEKEKYLLDVVTDSFLAHGDFGVDHIFQNNGSYSGIIDFGDIRGTSKYHDLSHIYTFDNYLFDPIYRGYCEIHKLPVDSIDKIKVEAVVFGITKLWWVSKSIPERVKDHPVFDLLNRVL